MTDVFCTELLMIVGVFEKLSSSDGRRVSFDMMREVVCRRRWERSSAPWAGVCCESAGVGASILSNVELASEDGHLVAQCGQSSSQCSHGTGMRRASSAQVAVPSCWVDAAPHTLGGRHLLPSCDGIPFLSWRPFQTVIASHDAATVVGSRALVKAQLGSGKQKKST